MNSGVFENEFRSVFDKDIIIMYSFTTIVSVVVVFKDPS